MHDYPELGCAGVDPVQTQLPPIFITGRFRSGSTLQWNLFRHVDGCRAHYEPLNERRWFDPGRRDSHVDSTHIGVSDCWREYDGLEHLGRLFYDDWWRQNLYMDERSWDPGLASYVQGLVDAAVGQRAVLQFNRVDFQLLWLRHWFPRAVVVHIYRHPREQWCSTLMDLRRFPRNGRTQRFEPHDHFTS